jgi:hypothetical protein
MKKPLLVCLMLFANAAFAKCIDVHQEISGVVVDSSGQPIEGAIIYASWNERSKIKTRTEQSGPKGRFSVHIIFDAYSGSGLRGEDQCEGKFEEFSLGASKPGFVDTLQRIRASTKPVRTTVVLRKVGQDG